MATKSRKPRKTAAVAEVAPTPQPEAAPQPVEAPMYYASQIGIESAGNDFTLTFNRGRPVNGLVAGQNVALAEPQAIVSLSPQTAKDLWLVLSTVLGQWEERFGQIQSPFTEAQDAKKAVGANKVQ